MGHSRFFRVRQILDKAISKIGRSRSLRILVILVLVGVALSLSLWLASGPDDWKGLGLNLATELVGAVVTYILIERFIERGEEREEEKARLIEDLGSDTHDVAMAAVETLRRRGWLVDGSLRGAPLWKANLKDAVLWQADLQRAKLVVADLRRADLRGAKLQGAYLMAADLRSALLEDAKLQKTDLRSAKLQGTDFVAAKLQNAKLGGAKLQGARLWSANLQGADLQTAKVGVLEIRLQDPSLGSQYRKTTEFNEGTILPDGTAWTPDTDVTRFTDPNHPHFWRSDDPRSPAYRGEDG